MTRHAKVLDRLLGGRSDHGLRFDELCSLLRRLGFIERQRAGSHHIFSRDGIREIINLQPRVGGAAKPYQVRQVRNLLLTYGLADALRVARTDPGADDEA